MKEPECLRFAMDFLGSPEDSIILDFIEELKREAEENSVNESFTPKQALRIRCQARNFMLSDEDFLMMLNKKIKP